VTVIRTFTANPAVDRTFNVEELRLDVPLRPFARRELPGGKGINVARAIGYLGGRAHCYGVVGGYAGRWFVDELDAEGLAHRFVVDGSGSWQTRTTTVVTDDRHAVLVYDRGDPIPQQALLDAVERCLTDLEQGVLLVISGSLPEGDHEAAFLRLMVEARNLGAVTIVDSSDAGLRVALACGVDTIKVDHEEAAEVTGSTNPAAAAIALLDGCDRAVVTAGASGAVAVTRSGDRFRVATPQVGARHPAGSGDAFAAALALGHMAGSGWADALRSAAAAGAANTLVLGAGRLERDTYDDLVARTPLPSPLTTTA
jgi:1-phosphofructokinase family hexose kinase